MGSHSNNKVKNEENEWKIGENIPKNGSNFSKNYLLNRGIY